MNITIPDEIAAEVEQLASTTGQTAENLMQQMISEGIKMLRVPGIVFADGATGRRARIAGTGIEVFEVIYAYEAFNHDKAKVKQDLSQLEMFQIDAAVAYYEAYPEEISFHLKSDEQAQAEMEALWAEIPQTSPNWHWRRRVGTSSL